MSGRTLPGLGRTGAAGFTLIELVVVIALIGAVGTMGAGLIARAVDMYRNTGARSALVDEAEVAVRRLSRELAGALPNSIRIVNADGGVYLEYVPVLASGRYRAFASVSAEPTGNDPLEFNAVPPDTSFQVLGPPVDAEVDAVADLRRRAARSVDVRDELDVLGAISRTRRTIGWSRAQLYALANGQAPSR